MSDVVQTVRLVPARAVRVLGSYDVDCVAIELSDQGEVLDFRLELGDGYRLAWLLPIGRNGRLRLVHLGFVTADEEPALAMDPCAPDFGPEEWIGELARVGPDRLDILQRVRVELTNAPRAYRCECVVRQADGTRVTATFEFPSSG